MGQIIGKSLTRYGLVYGGKVNLASEPNQEISKLSPELISHSYPPIA